MSRSYTKKSAALVIAFVILAIGIAGSMMMFEVLRDDDFNIDQFMKSLAILMIAVTCWIPTHPILKKVMQKTKATMSATTESLIEKTGKMFAYQEKVGQES